MNETPSPKYLFIGGAADGQHLHVEEGRTWVSMPAPEPPRVCAPASPSYQLPQDRQAHQYRRKTLGSPERTWYVFVHDSVRLTEVMERLIQNYRKP